MTKSSSILELQSNTEKKHLERSNHLLTLSAKNLIALQKLAKSYLTTFANTNHTFADICFTTNTRRSHFNHRLAIVAESVEQMQQQLGGFVNSHEPERFLYREIPVQNEHHKIAFMFTGQGSQYAGMARVLYETQPTFRRVLNQCEEILRPYLEIPLLSVIYPEGNDSLELHQTAYTQPALFAIEYALAQLWQSYGIFPSAVMGHSVGEYTAACIAGVFSCEDGLKLITERARLIQSLPQNGMMAAVFISEELLAELIEPYKDTVAIATINGSQNVVISGLKETLEQVLSKLQSQDIQFRQLQVSHAFHSPLMNPILDSFKAFLDKIDFQSPSISLLSNVTGKFFNTGEIPDADYWVRHLRNAVRFATGMEVLAEQNYNIFIEIGPSSTLLNMGQHCLNNNFSKLWLPSLKRGQSDWLPFLNSLGQLYINGVEIDWSMFDKDYQRKLVSLPNYPFERQSYRESFPIALRETEIKQTSPKTSESQPHCFYEWQWQPETISTQQVLSSGAILVLGNPQILPKDWETYFTSQAHVFYWVMPGDSFYRDVNQFTINPNNSQDYELLITTIKEEQDSISAVIHLWNYLEPIDKIQSFDEEILTKSAYSIIFLGQALVKYYAQNSIVFLVLTLDTYKVLQNDLLQGIHQIIGATFTQIWAEENPNLKTKVVDLISETLSSEKLGEIIQQELFIEPNEEGIIAIRDNQRFGRILQAIPYITKQPLEEIVKDGDTYLITGGLSAVASEMAKGLVNHARLNLVLTGRKPLPPKEQWTNLLTQNHPQSIGIKTIQELEKMGATVMYEAVDVTNKEAMSQLMAKIHHRFEHLNGVIHAAGIQHLKNFTLREKKLESISQVLAPKIQGTLILDTLTRFEPLKFFIMTSSASASKRDWGERLGDYAVANIFLDHYAIYRSQQDYSGRSLAINFGPWQDLGMTKIGGQALIMLAKTKGINILEPNLAVDSFLCVLSSQTPSVIHIIDLVKPLTTTKATPLLVTSPIDNLEQLIKNILAHHISIPIEKIKSSEAFIDLGLDSLGGIEMIQELNQTLKLKLSPALLFQYQNIDQLVNYLEQNYDNFTPKLKQAQLPKSSEIKQKHQKTVVTDIAIIGMACKIPGANNLDEYWNLLSQGRSVIYDIGDKRWLSQDYFDSTAKILYKDYCQQGGFIENPYNFDPLFFGISPKEAIAMDPQQRIFLQIAWQAIQQAGYGGKYTSKDICVFVGCVQDNYIEHFVEYKYYGVLREHIENSDWFKSLSSEVQQNLQDMLINTLEASEITPEAIGGNDANEIAARVSHCLDLTGPSLTLSTACSSSLVALHLACDYLRTGQSSMAIVGGVNLNLSPSAFIFLSRVQALSPTGTCYPFDSRANGMVLGEGIGAIVLKPLQQAIADGDYIHAVIKGSAINNDGHSQGITAPNPEGQAEAIRQAYERYGIDPNTISYIETHGTGTSLGDPIEMEGMTQAFRKFTEDKQFCGIGSVKSSIGHSLSASGIISLIKVVLSMQNKYIPPTQGFETPNPNINFAESPFYVVGKEGKSWSNQEHPLRAGVNGFGFGGTNAHIIVEEAPVLSNSSIQTEALSSYLLLLTARTPAKLQEIARQLRDHLIANLDVEIGAVCLTMNNAQKEFSSKAALLVKNRSQFLERLEAIANNATNQPEIYLGKVNPQRSTPLYWLLDNNIDFTVQEAETLTQQYPVFGNAYNECKTLWQKFINNSQSTAQDKVHTFAVQYALGFWFKSLNIKPTSLFAKDTGFLVGATLIGLVTLEEALAALARLEGEKMVLPLKKEQSDLTNPVFDCSLITPQGMFNSKVQLSSVQLSALVQLGGTLNINQDTIKAESVFLYLGNSNDVEKRFDLKNDSLISMASNVESMITNRVLNVLGRLYVMGVSFDSRGLFSKGIKRVILPSYPFEQKIYKVPLVKFTPTVNSELTDSINTEEEVTSSASQKLLPMANIPTISVEERNKNYEALVKALGIK